MSPCLIYPPSSSATNAKCQSTFDGDPPTFKKAHTNIQGMLKPIVEGEPVEHQATAARAPKTTSPKTSYGMAATSHTVVIHGSDGRVIPGSQPRKQSIPSDQDHHPDPHPSKSLPVRDNGRLATAPHTSTPPPPAQWGRNRLALKSAWSEPFVDKLPLPARAWKSAATSAPSDKKPPHRQPPLPVDPRDRLDAARDKINANARQPTTAINKTGAAQVRVDKQWHDKPQTDQSRANKPRADKPRADKLRTDKTGPNTLQGTSLAHLHECRALINCKQLNIKPGPTPAQARHALPRSYTRNGWLHASKGRPHVPPSRIDKSSGIKEPPRSTLR